MKTVWIFYTNFDDNDYMVVKPFDSRDKAIEYMLSRVNDTGYIMLETHGELYDQFIKYSLGLENIKMPRKIDFMFLFEYDAAVRAVVQPILDKNAKRIERIMATGYFSIGREDCDDYEWFVREFDIE